MAKLSEWRKYLIQQLQGISPQPETDAQTLIEHVTDKTTTFILTYPDTPLNHPEKKKLEEYLNRALNHEPIAYIVGSQEFYNLQFKVNEHTLIPRASTECLVDWILANFTTDKLAAIDLGTGSGCIAISLASNRPAWQLTAADISPQTLNIAKDNGHLHNCHNIDYICSDWFAAIPAQQFNLIISNPPYIDKADTCFAEASIHFEPRSALISANHGLADIANIITDSAPYLAPDGTIAIEHGNEQAVEVQKLLQSNGYHSIQTFSDLSGHPRFTVAKRT